MTPPFFRIPRRPPSWEQESAVRFSKHAGSKPQPVAESAKSSDLRDPRSPPDAFEIFGNSRYSKRSAVGGASIFPSGEPAGFPARFRAIRDAALQHTCGRSGKFAGGGRAASNSAARDNAFPVRAATQGRRVSTAHPLPDSPTADHRSTRDATGRDRTIAVEDPVGRNATGRKRPQRDSIFAFGDRTTPVENA